MAPTDLDPQPPLTSAADDRAETRSPRNGFVSVVLPCLNEADSVGLVVQEAIATLESAGFDGEVIVVDNGSQDRSGEIALAAGARVIYERRRGYGRALRSGIEQAKGAVVVMADADWTYDLTKIPVLVEPVLNNEADITIGSRLHAATRHTMPLLHRYVGTPVLTALVKGAGASQNLPDSQSGFRCFRKDAISRLHLRADGMEFASEMLIKGSRHRLRIVDIPTGYRQRIGESKLNTLADGWRHLRLILLLAPEISLTAPGAALLVLGVLLSIAGFLPSRGVEIGSLRWQPIFFASIAVVVGLQAMLVGLVFIWRRAQLGGPPPGRTLRFMRSALFPRVCWMLGVLLMLAGLGLDALLFAKWIQGHSGINTELATASVAQTLLLAGAALTSFGLVVTWLHWDQRQNREDI